MRKCSVLLTPLLLLTACTQSPQSPQRNDAASASPASRENKAKPDPKPLFADLNKLCHALDGADLPAGLWKKIPDWDYQCISSYRDFGPDVPLRSNIAYYVSGKSADRADEVKIVVNVHARGSEPESRKLLFSTASQWFQSVEIAMPAALSAAIRSNRRFDGTAGNYKLEYWSEQNGSVLEKHLKIS